MNLPSATGHKPGTFDAQSSTIYLHRRWLILTRILWTLFVVLTLWILFANLPIFFIALHTICRAASCADYQLTPSAVRALQSFGFSLNSYALSFFVLKCLSVLIWFTIASIIVWQKYNDWFALLVALFLIMLGTFDNIEVETTLAGSHFFQWFLTTLLVFLAFVIFFLVFSLFPDGRFLPRWMLWPFISWIIFLIPNAFFPGSPFNIYTWSEALGNIVWFGFLVTLGIAQIYRYRHISDSIQRQQTKWVVFAIAVGVSVLFSLSALAAIFPTLSQPESLFPLAHQIIQTFAGLLIPLSISVAILRYRLWDIDIIINRTLVYGVLTVSTLALYIFVVVGLGSLLQVQGNILLSLLATGLIAIIFQPLRSRLQRSVNRLLYGERDEPYQVISRLGQRMEATLAPDAVLPAIVETVAQALKLPYAAVTLKQDQEFPIVASYGRAVDTSLHVPLLYQAEQVGELLLAPRTRGDSFTPADRRLLNDLARQAGVAAHAVRLNTDLQHSRERLVTTREEERRRLRRDLHDGLGPALASITLKLDAVRNLLTRNPSAADAVLVDLKKQMQTAIADIRRLVYELRPPSLDELGLLSALREQADQYMHDGLHITIDAPEQMRALAHFR